MDRLDPRHVQIHSLLPLYQLHATRRHRQRREEGVELRSGRIRRDVACPESVQCCMRRLWLHVPRGERLTGQPRRAAGCPVRDGVAQLSLRESPASERGRRDGGKVERVRLSRQGGTRLERGRVGPGGRRSGSEILFRSWWGVHVVLLALLLLRWPVVVHLPLWEPRCPLRPVHVGILLIHPALRFLCESAPLVQVALVIRHLARVRLVSPRDRRTWIPVETRVEPGGSLRQRRALRQRVRTVVLG